MAWDIHGNKLRPGYCEVHPYVAEEYPCSLCQIDIREEERRRLLADSNNERLYTREETEKLVLAAMEYVLDTLRDKRNIDPQDWLDKNL